MEKIDQVLLSELIFLGSTLNVNLPSPHNNKIDEPSNLIKRGYLSLRQDLRGTVPLHSPYKKAYSDNFDSFHGEAVNMLTHYLLQSTPKIT